MRNQWLLLCVFAILIWSQPSFAKSYYLDNIDVTVDVMPDGTYHVTEALTFNFEGCFTEVWRDIWLANTKGQRMGITGIGVTGEGVKNVYQRSDGEKLTFGWFYSACDTKRTFTLSYDVSDALYAYNDIADFYWQFVGDQWDVDVRHFTGTVRLPAGIESDSLVRAWGHRGLQVESVGAGTVTFKRGGIPPYTLVEGRVVFPSSAVRVGPSVRINADKLDEIVFEEENTNKALDTIAWFLSILPYLIVLTTLTMIGIAWYKWGREPKVDFTAKYLMEPPSDIPPAIVGCIMNPVGEPTTADVFATIIDLAIRGYLTIVEVDKPGFLGSAKALRFTRTDKKEGFNDYEKDLLEFFFRKKGAGLLGGMNYTLTGKPTDVVDSDEMAVRTDWPKFFNDWKKKIAKAEDEYGYIDQSGVYKYLEIFRTYVLPALSTIVGLFIYMLFGMGFELGISFLVAMVASMLAVNFAVPTLYRRTQKGALENARWNAFKNMLKDYSQLKKLPATGYVLWDRYFAYATSLGVAEQLSKFIDAEVKNYKTGWYTGSHMSFGLMRTSFHNMGSSTSTHGGRGGGGFHGGGGGGFGGGGGGAR